MAGSVRSSAKPAIATSWRSIAATSSGRARKRGRRPGDNSSRAIVNAATAPVTRPVVARLWVAASTASGRTGSARPSAAIPSAPASRSTSSWADSRRGGPENTGDSMYAGPWSFWMAGRTHGRYLVPFEREPIGHQMNSMEAGSNHPVRQPERLRSQFFLFNRTAFLTISVRAAQFDVRHNGAAGFQQRTAGVHLQPPPEPEVDVVPNALVGEEPS